MKAATKGDTVRVHYTGHLGDGQVFDSSEGSEPLQFRLGAGEVIPGFDRAVTGLTPGEKTRVTIPPDDAYGPRRDELMIEVPREQFPPQIDPQPGMQLNLQQEAGPVIVTVAAVSDGAVILDGNHPLAGQELTFDLQLVDIG
jgi:peptidylprolyl isomerase